MRKRPVEAASRTSVITWKATELEGADVRTPTGEQLGEIEELAIDANGRVSYVALSVGGFLGTGERLVAVPWDSLKCSLGGRGEALPDSGEHKRCLCRCRACRSAP